MKRNRSRCRSLFTTALVVWTLGLWIGAVQAVEERILLDATINGKAVRLVFDTGASDLILFPQSAERLGLEVTQPPAGFRPPTGVVAMGRTEECDFVLGTTRTRIAFRVFAPPSFFKLEMDGAVGWRPVRYNTIRIDADLKQAVWLTNTPPETAAWVKLRVRGQAPILTLEVPSPDEPQGVVTVDTGWSGGVALSPAKWSLWKAAHTNAPTTLQAGYMPGAGTVAAEESWAREMAFGPLALTEVPVTAANAAQQAADSARLEASLGLAALKQVDLIVDGLLGIAYVRPKNGRPVPYDHNRLGAVFVPPSMEGGDLAARVLEGSPAYAAGIRNGDVLLKVGDLDATKWRTDPAVLPLSRFWERPPGTRLDLTLRRGTEVFKATPVLRQILGPGAGSAPKASNR
jgi:hypothetical protein